MRSKLRKDSKEHSSSPFEKGNLHHLESPPRPSQQGRAQSLGPARVLSFLGGEVPTPPYGVSSLVSRTNFQFLLPPPPSPSRSRAPELQLGLGPAPAAMATRNRTPLYRKYRDALRHVRSPAGAPSSSGGGGGGAGGGGGPVIEMASLLRSDRTYAPLSTDDPSASRCHNPPTPLASRLVPSLLGISEVASCDAKLRDGSC